MATSAGQATLRKAMNTMARVRVPSPAPLDTDLHRLASANDHRSREMNRLRVEGKRLQDTKAKNNDNWQQIGDNLGQFVSERARMAINHKISSGVQQEQIDALRYYYGNYSVDELRDLPDGGETALWFPLIETFTKRMYAFIIDTVTNEKGVPQFDLRSTAVPDVPPQVLDTALEAIQERLLLQIEQGIVVTPTQLRQAVVEMTDTLFEEAKAGADYAIRKCKRALDDRLDESNYFTAWSEAVFDAVLCGTGLLYGPYPVLENAGQFDDNNEIQYGYHKRMQWRSLDKLYLFPSQCSTDTQDGEYLIYLDKLSRKQLFEARSCPGWISDNIEFVLRTHPNGYSSCNDGMFGDIRQLRAMGYGKPDTRYDTTWYIGCVPGTFLLEQNITSFGGKAIDELNSYEVEIFTVAGLPVRIQLPLDPKCQRPVHRAVMFESAGSFYGRGTYQRLCDLQRLANSTITSVPYDMSYTAFPIFEVDQGMAKQDDDGNVGPCDIFPGAVIEKDSTSTGVAGKMVNVTQIQSNVGGFMNLLQEIIGHAEDLMGLPRYLSGGPSGSGALRTASGLQQLQSNAFINLKCIIRNFDDGLTKPSLAQMHRMIAYATDDPDLRGDVEVVVLGHTQMLARQIHRDNLAQNLGLFMPFMQAGIIPMEGVLDLLREIASIGGYDPRKLIPDSQYEAAKQAEYQTALSQVASFSGGIASAASAGGALGGQAATAPGGAVPGVQPAGFAGGTAGQQAPTTPVGV